LDEAGPYLVKPQPGQKWYLEKKIYKTPATWKTKGKIVVFGALKTNPGKIYHHIDNNKRYKILKYFIWRIVKLYRKMKKIYFIWDNAKVHETKALEKGIEYWNKIKTPKIEILPLPTYSPWLNPIEPVFGDLYKKVVAGSNFRWPKDMADSIHKYFHRRNWQEYNSDN
jgi:transposase